MSDTPEGNICKVSANLGWASDTLDTLAMVDKAMLKLSAEVKTILRERDNLKQEVERLKTMSVCELGAHNNSVRDYMGHWEGRALTAERERDQWREIARIAVAARDHNRAMWDKCAAELGEILKSDK